MSLEACRAGLLGCVFTFLFAACGGQGSQRGSTPPALDVPSRADILAASDLPETIAAPLPNDPTAMTVHRLSNGMSVYITTDRQDPSFYGWIAVRAGSRHDPEHATGLAHYLEHMLLFKGSDELGTTDHASEEPHLARIRELYRKLPNAEPATRASIFAEIDVETQAVAKLAIPNEISRLYAAQGFKEINAYTNKDRTYYVQRVPSNRREMWATVEAERFADPVFRLFYPELEAVYEEKNRGIDSSWRTLSTLTNEGLFSQHPYGTQTTLGTIEHLKTPAFDEMVAFYQRWYVPNNMAIILAGDVDASILGLLESKFGGLEPKALPDPPPGKLPAVQGRVLKEFSARGEHVVRIAWKTVPPGHEDAPALAVLDRRLDDGPAGLMKLELALPQLVHWARSAQYHYREVGAFVVQAGPRLGQSHEEVEGLLRETVAHLQQVSREDVEAAKLSASIDHKRAAESPRASAGAALDAFVRHRQWADVVQDEQRLQALTREQVVAAAQKYLGQDSVVVFQHDAQPSLEKVAKPKITPLVLDPTRSSNMAKRVEALAVDPLEPHWLVEGENYTRQDLPSGPLYASLNTRSDLFQLEYRFDLGVRKASLLCTALGQVDRAGTPKLAPAEVKQALYRLGASIDVGCDAERTRVVVQGVDRNFEATLALMDALFDTPVLAAEQVDKVIKAQLERRRNHLVEEQTVTGALVEFALYAGQSRDLAWPSNKELSAAGPRRLRKQITSLFGYRHRTLYFGPRTGSEVSTLVTRGKKHRATGPIAPRVSRKLLAPRIFFLHREQAKATVRVGFASQPRGLEQTPEAQLLSRYLGGGIGSITFREIRSARGLAYSVSAGVGLGRPGDDVWLWGWMQNQGDKVAEALPALLEVLQRAHLEEGRFRESYAQLDEAYRATRVNPRQAAARADTMHDLGFAKDPGPSRWKHLAQLDGPALARFAAELAAGPPIIAIVGDRNAIDLSTLRGTPETTQVGPEQLFSYGPFE